MLLSSLCMPGDSQGKLATHFSQNLSRKSGSWEIRCNLKDILKGQILWNYIMELLYYTL